MRNQPRELLRPFRRATRRGKGLLRQATFGLAIIPETCRGGGPGTRTVRSWGAAAVPRWRMSPQKGGTSSLEESR